MNKRVLEYFEDLHSLDLPKQDASFVEDGKSIKRIGIVRKANSARKVVKYNIDGREYFCKSESEKRHLLKTHEMASSKMYGDLGITTPPVYHLLRKDFLTSKYPGLLTQDVYDIEKIDCILASELKAIARLEISPSTTTNPYEILFNEQVRQKCLEIMTPRCLEEVVDMYLLGDLRSDSDIHPDNYFLYKKKGAKRYTGIIPIDLEHSQVILSHLDTKEKFDTFVKKTKYDSCVPFRYRSSGEYGFGKLFLYNGTYQDRLDIIKNLIQSGKLKKRQIELIGRAINYDFPAAMRDIAVSHGFGKKQLDSCDTVSRLWENNHKELSREL